MAASQGIKVNAVSPLADFNQAPEKHEQPADFPSLTEHLDKKVMWKDCFCVQCATIEDRSSSQEERFA
jgi:hypothetical protein